MSSISNDNFFESINLGATVDIEKPHLKPRTQSKTLSISASIPESVSATSDDDDLDPAEFISSESPLTKKTVLHAPYDSDKIEPIHSIDHSSKSTNSTILDESTNNNNNPKSTSNSNINHNRNNSNTPILLFTPKIADSEFFTNPSRILSNSLTDELDNNRLQYSYNSPSFTNSAIFPLDNNLNNVNQSGDSESPIEFLSNKNKLLFKELQQNLQVHKEFVSSGDTGLMRRRNMIGQNFDQLSENFYSLNELYAKDITYTESLYSSFRKWDRKRNKILDKIVSIKSDKSKYGAKLTGLLDESREIDAEIEALEKKLNSLKSKKRLINTEIQDTSSVLESKTSKYVESFKQLESQGKDAMLSFLMSNGIPQRELSTIIKSTPVNVTFINGYNNKLASERIISEPTTVKTEVKPLVNGLQPVETSPLSSSGIGMKPFVPPDLVEQPSSHDNENWNHGHGPTAYEKGYAKGAKSTAAVKNHINNFIHTVFASLPEHHSNNNDSVSTTTPLDIPPTASVDDSTNTVSEKLELEPVLKLLEHKVGALSDIVLLTSNKATIFHEYGTIWKDIVAILKVQESKLSDQIEESVSSELSSNLSNVLTLTLTQIKSCLESMKSFNSTFNGDSAIAVNDNLFSEAVLNELRALLVALSMFSNASYEKYLIQYQEVGFSEDSLRVASGHQIEASVPKGLKSISPPFKTAAIVNVGTESATASTKVQPSIPKDERKQFFGLHKKQGKSE